jgi:hypothetical protein
MYYRHRTEKEGKKKEGEGKVFSLLRFFSYSFLLIIIFLLYA